MIIIFERFIFMYVCEMVRCLCKGGACVWVSKESGNVWDSIKLGLQAEMSHPTRNLDSLQKKRGFLTAELSLHPVQDFPAAHDASFITSGPQVEAWAVACGKCMF